MKFLLCSAVLPYVIEAWTARLSSPNSVIKLGIEFVYESAYKAPHGYQQKDRIAVIAVAPTGKASFVYSYVQTRLKGE